jgi:AraC family ethanolamine operon transcriptional activator
VDLDRLTASIHGWNTRFTQLAPGPGLGSISETLLPAARLIRLALDTTAALRAFPLAAHPDELFHVGTLSFARDTPVWQGFAVGPNTLMLEAGEVPSRFVLPAGCELLVARLDRGRIESLSRVLRGGADEPAGCRTEVYRHSPAALDALRAHLRALARADLGDRAQWIAVAEDDLYERVSAMLVAAPVHGEPPPDGRRRALRRAEEYLHARAGQRFTLSDLCGASGCSERTLRTAFRECYGTSPMAFVKKLRLQALQQDLRNARPSTARVLDLALRWGFWHMGHLGRDYKRLFGETPSETLAGRRKTDGGGADRARRYAFARRASSPATCSARPRSARTAAPRGSRQAPPHAGPAPSVTQVVAAFRDSRRAGVTGGAGAGVCGRSCRGGRPPWTRRFLGGIPIGTQGRRRSASPCVAELSGHRAGRVGGARSDFLA